MPDGPSGTDPSGLSQPTGVPRNAVAQPGPAQGAGIGPLANFLTQMNFGTPMVPQELLQKITPEHISKTLDLAQAEQDNRFRFASRQQAIQASTRWFLLLVFGISLTVVLVLVFGLKDKPEILTPALTGIFGLAAGALGGFGYAKSRHHE